MIKHVGLKTVAMDGVPLNHHQVFSSSCSIELCGGTAIMPMIGSAVGFWR
jgi:hypothetical protein